MSFVPLYQSMCKVHVERNAGAEERRIKHRWAANIVPDSLPQRAVSTQPRPILASRQRSAFWALVREVSAVRFGSASRPLYHLGSRCYIPGSSSFSPCLKADDLIVAHVYCRGNLHTHLAGACRLATREASMNDFVKGCWSILVKSYDAATSLYSADLSARDRLYNVKVGIRTWHTHRTLIIRQASGKIHLAQD